MPLYVDKSARELRQEERTLSAVLRTGTLPNSNVRCFVDRDAVRERLLAVREGLAPRVALAS